MAGEKLGSLHYELSLDSSKLNQGLDNADRKMANFGNKLSSVGDTLGSVGQKMTLGITLPLAALGALAIKQASDLTETINKVDVAFKDQSSVVKEWGNTTIKSFGMAKQTALDAAALFGDMATSMGLNTKEAAEMSMSLVGLAGDLASFKNVSADIAKTALAGIFTGETESLKQLGIIMTDTNVKAYALSKGFTGNWEQATQAEKVVWRYKYVLDQTKNAQGDFARTSDSTANQMRIVQERFKELGASIGEKLLPYANKALEWVNKLMDKFEQLSSSQQNTVLVFLGIAAAIGPLLIALGMLASALGAIAANPIVLLIAVIVAGLVLLGIGINKVVEKFGGWGAVIEQLRPTFEKMVVIWQTKIVPALKEVWDWLEKHVFTMDNWNKMVEFAKKTWDTIVTVWQTVVLPALKWLWHTIKDELIPTIVEFWQQNKDWLIPTLITLAAIVGIILVAGIVMAIVTLRTIVAAVTVVVGIFNWLSGVIQWVNDKFTELSLGAFRMVVGVVNWFSQLPGRIMGAIGSLGSILYNAGRDLLQGLIDGIHSIADNVVGALRGVANKLPQIVKDILGIHSPSQVFHEIGQNIGLGIATGITSTTGVINTALTNLTPEMIATGLSAGSAGVSSSVRYGDTNISIGAIHNQSDADYLIRRIDHKQKLETKGVSTL